MNFQREIPRFLENLKKFGITPDRVFARFAYNDKPRIIANSIPKSGTNLLLKALYSVYPFHRSLIRTINTMPIEHIERKLNNLGPGQIASAHLHYSEELSLLLKRNNMKHILIIRDPRDIAVSNFIYITYKDRKHRMHGYFKNQLKDDDERLMASLEGVKGDLLPDGKPAEGLRYHIEKFCGWLNDKSCLVVRFEELIGEKGGGDRDLQLMTLRKIYDFIGVRLSSSELDKISSKVFSSYSRTFHKGQTGVWKTCFDRDHIEIARKEFGELLLTLGYEKDLNWNL